MHKLTNIMTVDVEDYFHVGAFEKVIKRENWDTLEYRVPKNTLKVLKLFDKFEIKATFFMLGWVAKKSPQLVKTIVSEGHELASHGFWHQRVCVLSREEFYQDLKDSKAILEDLSGRLIKGYRAPSYSINHQNQWAFEVIEDLGFKYSSSIYPILHDHYGWPNAPRFKFLSTPKGLIEIPISTTYLGNKKVPAGGGGFFRFFPYKFSKMLIDKVNIKEQQPAIFYFHPWELDPEQPKQKGTLKSNFRHYLNLHKMEARLNRLLNDFRWGSIENVFF